MKSKTFTPLRIFLWSLFIGSYVYLFYFYVSEHSSRTVLAPSGQEIAPAKSTEKVTRVIDGDTFEINGGIKVRLIGVDTPEMKSKNKTVDCFAAEATKRLGSLIQGKEVRLEKDVSETDRYGRLLRYVYIGNQMINDTLVKEGYAKISTFPPDVKFKDQFIASERRARDSKSGLWQACK